ncbi:DUF7010 family protein [Aliidiomarina maris]|uniref:DUF308 domain-containing protein n=1 Tax=Aliidiomarina maris TaxID=531312 RepID=A0A327WRV3_9GAMM|nr:hypothetical protein [Aliidiomarina maris]RAJ93957.1 hypothetical protein B0I24_11560 [Aliidiomarina maris]RUO27538.1 hypothetical protein CWE07_02600 [Aliidiomarina maris]
MQKIRTLEEQREEFAQRRLIALPIAGLIAWAVIGIGSLFLSPFAISMLLFAATGSIVYLGMFISKFTGENFLEKGKPKNTFDTLFFYSFGMSLLVFGIAIPFFQADYTSLPLTVGILTGLMWLPITWIIQHWIGVIHGVARTITVVMVWYIFPDHRFLAVSIVIVLLYVFAIAVLELRWRGLRRQA